MKESQDVGAWGVPVRLRDVVSFDGTKLRCWVVGRGMPLLVSNPVAVHPTLWLPLARRLDGEFALVLWESRGMWDSECPADASAVTVADQARDLTSIAAALGLAHYGLVGFCAGALVACEALQDAGCAPSKVMLISAPFRHTAQQSFVTFIRRLRERPSGWPVMVSFCRGFTPPELRDTLDSTFQDGPRVLRFLLTLESYYEYEPRTEFPREFPLWLVVAEDDPAVIKESNARILEHRARRGDSLWEVPGIHYSAITRPDAIHRIIAQCFSDGRPAPAFQAREGCA